MSSLPDLMPRPLWFAGENNDPEGDIEEYISQMREDARLMREYAESEYFTEVLPGGRQKYDRHAFLVDVPDPHNMWVIDQEMAYQLKQRRDFVTYHVRVLTWWLYACGFSAFTGEFFDPNRISGSKDLQHQPIVAKFIQTLHLFASTRGKNSEINDAYFGLVRATAAFLAGMGFYGRYRQSSRGLGLMSPLEAETDGGPEYITPGEFMQRAGMVDDANLYEERVRQNGPFKLGVNTAFVRRALKPFVQPGFKRPVSSPSIPQSTEEASYVLSNRFLVVTLVALLLIEALLYLRIRSQKRTRV